MGWGFEHLTWSRTRGRHRLISENSAIALRPQRRKGLAMAFDAFGIEGMPFYCWYEMQHAALGPYRAAADATRLFFQNPVNPLTHTTLGKSIAAGCEMFERVTRRYGKPDWTIQPISIAGARVTIHPETVWERPFCRLIHFERALPDSDEHTSELQSPDHLVCRLL